MTATARLTRTPRAGLLLIFLVGVVLAVPAPVEAYVGPGAGFALISSMFVLLISFALSILTLLTWPFRWVLSTIRGKRALAKSRIQKAVVVGLDGMDPVLTDQFLAEGVLPNLARLRESGSYHRLQTTLPAESPVAWSSFQTGCNPGRHRIFDFFMPSRSSYLPVLATADVGPPKRTLKLGSYRIPLGKGRLTFKRASKSFWKVLGEHGIFSTILRVPVSFPPEKFKGLLLSAMSVPDLNGTQGTFSFFTTDAELEKTATGGTVTLVEREGPVVEAVLEGPQSPLRESDRMRIPLRIEARADASDRATLHLQGRKYELQKGEFTPWIPVKFKAGLGVKVSGICRFLLTELDPHFKLYVTPINIDPQKPALPVSHPTTYSIYLARSLGDFSTLGMCEDTWALNEGVLDDEAFLKQTYSIHEEREKMFFDALSKTERGAVVCVFDITDRLQHMFWRHLEPEHPANSNGSLPVTNAIRQLYLDMDKLVGKVIAAVDDETFLVVMSDHGFKSFQRGINLNSWLHQNGYLHLTGDPDPATEWLSNVDWSRTRAFALGMGGVFVNQKGREAQGIVEPGAEAEKIKAEIASGLEALVDDARDGRQPVRKVYDTRLHYTGPYVGEAPDLVVGFAPGSRVSWESAKGATTGTVIEDNRRKWSGDHCMNPPDVPGILFTNWRVRVQEPAIIDIGPTILDLFGVPVPGFCDGKPLLAVEQSE